MTGNINSISSSVLQEYLLSLINPLLCNIILMSFTKLAYLGMLGVIVGHHFVKDTRKFAFNVFRLK
jgi:xanthosine utilization system XapX-like protein